MRGRSVIIALVVWLLTVACSEGANSPQPSPTQTEPGEPSASVSRPVGILNVTGSTCTIDGVDGPIAAGSVSFTAVNETDGLAAFNIAAIEEGHSFDELASHIEEEIELADAGEPGLGHPSFAVPMFEVLLEAGETGTMSGSLDQGTYGLTCARVNDAVGELRPAGALGPIEVE